MATQIDQIAEEAVKQLHKTDYFHNLAIIKSACEKAKYDAYRQGREDLIDAIVGDLVRETNIFPNQVTRAKELIRERLNEKGIKETCQREP